MTGYGCKEKDGIRIEIRSVNHRYLNINMKMPATLIKYDIVLRNAIKGVIRRGNVDVYISFLPEHAGKVLLNNNYVANLIDTMKKLKYDYNLEGTMDVSTVLSFKDAFMSEPEEVEEGLLLELLNSALDELCSMRVAEAQSILNEINIGINDIERITNKIEEKSKGFCDRAIVRIEKRLNELIGQIVNDRERLLQEAAYLAEKTDIREEIDRLKSHVKQFAGSLFNNAIVGKKLDFIVQELYRETNTIAAKSQEYDIVALTVELKNKIEQLREQVQNIQ